MYKYAIVSGHLIQYLEGSLKQYVSEFDHTTPMVNYIDNLGGNCVTITENFITGTFEELKSLLDGEDRIHEEKVKMALDKFPHATSTEKQIIEYMIGDGYDPEDLTYQDISRTTEGTLRYTEFNSSLLDAYMDYMH